MCPIAESNKRIDFSVAGFFACQPRSRRCDHHFDVADDMSEKICPTVQKRAIGQFALDRFIRAHKTNALAHGVKLLGVLRDAYLGESVNNCADACGVDSYLCEQAEIADLCDQVDDVSDVCRQHAGHDEGDGTSANKSAMSGSFSASSPSSPAKRNMVRSPCS